MEEVLGGGDQVGGFVTKTCFGGVFLYFLLYFPYREEVADFFV